MEVFSYLLVQTVAQHIHLVLSLSGVLKDLDFSASLNCLPNELEYVNALAWYGIMV